MWLTTEDCSNIYSLQNLDEKTAKFHKKLIGKYQICFPEKRFKRCSIDKPFMNQTIKTLIRTKLKLFNNGKLDKANWHDPTTKIRSKNCSLISQKTGIRG